MFLVKWKKWSICRTVLLLAGLFISLGVALGYLVHPYFFALPGMIGIMLVVLAATGFCPMVMFLHKLGLPCDMTTKEPPDVV